jgi:Cu/Ag efflux pump CusA
LWGAAGAGALARQILGTVVISGMTAATLVGIFLVPVLFVIVEKIARRKMPVLAPQQTGVVLTEGVAD